MSLRSLTAYKLRSVFVICATALGIASLTVIVAAVDGAQTQGSRNNGHVRPGCRVHTGR